MTRIIGLKYRHDGISTIGALLPIKDILMATKKKTIPRKKKGIPKGVFRDPKTGRFVSMNKDENFIQRKSSSSKSKTRNND